MNRRAVLLAAALVSASALSSCASVDSSTVARVGDQKLSHEELAMLTDESTSGDAARTAIGNWLSLAIFGGDTEGITSPDELDARAQAASMALAGPHLAEGKALYDQGFGVAPLLCLGVIPLAAGTDPATVLAEIAGGTSFADAAAKYSADPTLAQAGGNYTSQNGDECVAESALNPDVISLFVDAGVGVGAPATVNYNDADLVVQLRPFDTLNETDQARMTASLVAGDLRAALAEADVWVDPRYGWWDPANNAVRPIGN